MAKQDSEEKDRGGLMGALGKAPGAAAALARKAANAYGVAASYAARAAPLTGGYVNPIIPSFMAAREIYDRTKRRDDIKERTAADRDYNPEDDPTLRKVRPAFGSTAITDPLAALAFSPIETTKKMLTRLTGREGAEESSELPQTVSDADLGISEPGANMYADLESEAVTEDPGANMYEDLEDSDDSGPVDYSLTNGSSTDTMGQDMDEGVGSEQKYDTYGFKSGYEGDYDNASAEWDALASEYASIHSGTSDIKLDSPEGHAVIDRMTYLTDKIDESNKRKTDADSASPGGGQTSTGGSTRTTAYRPGYDRTNNRGITGALEISAVPQDRAQELQGGRITLQGRSYDIVGNTGDKYLVPSPDQPDYSRLS